MVTVAYDENGKKWPIWRFKSRADAHQRVYFDDCGIPMTPCIYEKETGIQSHYRYVVETPGGVCNGVSPEHIIAQNRFSYLFKKGGSFWVKYWDRKPDGTISSADLDLRKYYDECRIEESIENRRADVLISSSTSLAPPILIEVWRTSYCKQPKIDEGHLIIEFRIKENSDICELVRSWGLKESFLSNKVPTVRFHNFRERRAELPWIDNEIGRV